MIKLPQLHRTRVGLFPDPESALAEPNGLLAWGGDLSPATSFATMLTCLEAMTGQVFMAVVIARLVGVQSAAEVEEDARAEDVAAEAEAME